MRRVEKGSPCLAETYNKILAACTDAPVIYTDSWGANYTTEEGAAHAKKMDNTRAAMRLGMVRKHMEDWRGKHPDATLEQAEAAARYVQAK